MWGLSKASKSNSCKLLSELDEILDRTELVSYLVSSILLLSLMPTLVQFWRRGCSEKASLWRASQSLFIWSVAKVSSRTDWSLLRLASPSLLVSCNSRNCPSILADPWCMLRYTASPFNLKPKNCILLLLNVRSQPQAGFSSRIIFSNPYWYTSAFNFRMLAKLTLWMLR